MYQWSGVADVARPNLKRTALVAWYAHDSSQEGIGQIALPALTIFPISPTTIAFLAVFGNILFVLSVIWGLPLPMKSSHTM
jgi:hypothetical protein